MAQPEQFNEKREMVRAVLCGLCFIVTVVCFAIAISVVGPQ